MGTVHVLIFPLPYFAFVFSPISRPQALSSGSCRALTLLAGLDLACRVGSSSALLCPGRPYPPTPSPIHVLESQKPCRSSLHEGNKAGFPSPAQACRSFHSGQPMGSLCRGTSVARSRGSRWW